MPSPDFSSYLDLTVYDKSIQDIYREALTYARTALPEWTPRTGTIEDAVLQAASYQSGFLAGAINRLPNGVMETLLKLFGIDRNDGTAPTGTVTVTVVDAAGYSIPVGTRFGYRETTGGASTLYVFETTAALIINAGATSGNVAIRGLYREQYPSLQSGTALLTLTSISSISTVTLTQDLSVGDDPETDAEYFNRGLTKLNSYSSSFVLPRQMESYLLSTYSDIYRVKVYSRLNSAGTLAASVSPSANGYVTVFASSVGASAVTTAASAIAADLAERTVPGLSIGVRTPITATINVATTIAPIAGYTNAEIEGRVTEALTAYLNPDNWDWETTVYRNNIVVVLARLEGVKRVDSVTLTVTGSDAYVSGNDVKFYKYGTLPVFGTLSYTPSV